MAISYQAKIDLIVAGLDQIKTAERRIKSLLAESKKLKRGSVAQRGTAALAATTRESRQQSRSTVRAAERRLELQSKLNSATDLYQRKLQQFQRAGGQNNKQLQARVDQITQAFTVGTKEGTKNLRLTRALGTELGRVVEKQLELNRATAQANKGFEAGRRGFERVEALRSQAFGNEKGLRAAESLVGKIGPAARSGDQVAFNEAVRKADAALRRLESEFQQAVKAQRKANKTKRDVERAEQKLANETKKAARDQASRRKKRFQDIATGAGFPLLFGGGPIQSLAGGLGGAFGGFGGSIAASAIASQVEAFGKAATRAGQAFNSTGGALDFMREKSLFSTAATEERAAVLEEQGRVEELATLLTQELTDKIGNEGVRSLQELGKTTSETTRLWSELTTQLFALISGPLNSFLKIVNQVLGGITTAGRFAALSKDLAGNKEFEAAVKARKSGRAGVLSPAEKLELLELFGPKVTSTAQIPVTPEDRRRFAVKGKAGEKVAREEDRIKQRLAALEVERKKILEISGFKDKIAAAEAANDSQLVIRLQGEQRIAEIETKRLSDLTKVKDQRLIDAINIKSATEKLAAQRETERQITEEQRKRQELFDTTIEDLEHQLQMTEATSQAERDRLKIAKELKKLEKKDLSDAQLGQAESVMKRLAVAQQPLNAFIRKTTEELNNLQQVAVNVSQGIGNAIGNSLVSGLQSLVTGAASIKEVFANMLKSVADVLAKTAAQMIAQYIAIGIARAFAGMGQSGGGPDPNSAGVTSVLEGGGFTTGSLADAAVSGASFATGGYVSSPTNALIGEGGEPEYVIPESKMRTAMSRYSRGSRGNSVIPESGATEAIGEGGGTAIAAPIDVRYTVERINSVDYVTADQFQAGMQQAAQQGAKQGEQQTLKRLQMSGSTRKRIGI